jgi:RNA polymerase sigma-70 factor (ECF subfamily)
MDDHSAVRSAQLQGWLQRMHAGDAAARDELLRAVCGRLERLARKMLRRFPSVHAWAQTDDVLQNALLRLLRALQSVRPATTQEFFGLAAALMRRELIDLARHYGGPRGIAALLAPPGRPDGQAGVADESPDRSESPEELERWAAFHRAVEGLPVEEREVVGLIFYHGWLRAEVATLLQTSVKTVNRRWQAAMVKLHRLLSDDPG